MSRQINRVVFILAVLVLSGCSRVEILKDTPADLLGVWTSDDPRYEGRYLELRPHEVIFGAGEGQAAQHTILQYERMPLDKRLQYKMTFLDDSDRTTLVFQHFPDRTIQFENQWVVWSKQGPNSD